MIGIMPEISRDFSSIGRNIEFAQAQFFNESKTERNCNYCEVSSSTNDYRGQHDTSCYQAQPASYNQRPHYLHYRTTQQAPYRTYYYREKVGKCGIIHSGIPSPYIKQLPNIPLVNILYYRREKPTVSSGTSLKIETSMMHQLK